MEQTPICQFTKRPLNKTNMYYQQDGTYLNADVANFLESIPTLPTESLEKLRDMSLDALNERLTFWQKLRGAFTNRRR